MPSPFTLTLHMVMSLDGFIAKKDNSIGWFDTTDHYEQGVVLSAEEMANTLKQIDCYVMGARTYTFAMELAKSYGWPYGDTPTVVISQQNLPVDRPNVALYAGDLTQLVQEKLKPAYKQVWLVGGPTLAKSFFQQNLIDEIRLSILPILLGDGTLFFDYLGQEQPLHLKNVTPYQNGIVELRYALKSPGNPEQD